MLDFLQDGREYILASRAAEKLGYASDYIGQLCRQKKVPGQLVGRTWYVDYEALLQYKKSRKVKKLEVAWTPTTSLPPKGLTLDSLASLLPPLSKASKRLPPAWNKKFVGESVAVALALIFVVTAGFATLEKTSPEILSAIRNSNTAAVSIGDFVSETLNSLLSRF